MNQPDKAPDDNSHPGQPDAHSPDDSLGSGKRQLRLWLLIVLLVTLIVLLSVRDDLRHDSGQALENGVHYLAFDVLGWSPRELFIWRLRVAGLRERPLGQRWAQAVDRASDSAVQTGAQFGTQKRFASDEVEAHVYQLALERGQKLVWQFARLDPADTHLFASLERRGLQSETWTTVTQLNADKASQSRLVTEDGDYRFVLQPELFASAEYSLKVAHGGSLPFPVEAASQRDIRSFFGDPRDGGAREHHGVDIFADKGTPVTAVIDGYVRTGSGGIGGKHIWLSGGMFGLGRARYYYAHLDDFAVASGDKVRQGEVIGYIGNTGNARTTPPHLHFGIYSGGPVDPQPFLKPEPQLPRP